MSVDGVFCGQKTGLDIRTPPEWGDVRSHQTPPHSPSRWNALLPAEATRGAAEAHALSPARAYSSSWLREIDDTDGARLARNPIALHPVIRADNCANIDPSTDDDPRLPLLLTDCHLFHTLRLPRLPRILCKWHP